MYTSTKTGNREYYESSYELRRFQALDKDPKIREWTKAHDLKLPYRLYRRRKNYIPDILVKYEDGTVFLEEVKGYIFRPREFLKKRQAAKLFCARKGWKYRTVFEKDLEST